MRERSDMDQLLAEQAAYYRAVADEYEEHAIPEATDDEVVAALARFRPAGEILELAPGPAMWTARLLPQATLVTAVDASPEMLRRASARVTDSRVQFLQADLFRWTPKRRYDVVFFGFWLSHVPMERFEAFWRMVEGALKPDGRVFFVDDAQRTPEELVEGDASIVVERRLKDGTPHRALKVPHTPVELEARLRELGWDIEVHPAGLLYWGQGRRGRTAPLGATPSG